MYDWLAAYGVASSFLELSIFLQDFLLACCFQECLVWWLIHAIVSPFYITCQFDSVFCMFNFCAQALFDKWIWPFILSLSLSLPLCARHTCFTCDTCILNISCKIVQEGYLVYECNSMCSCNKTCPNRVLQNGIRVKLEVFKTYNKVTNLPN